MPPLRWRIVTECVLTAFGTIIGYAFFILGIISGNYHTIIWGWFSGFCAIRVFVMQLSYLKHQFHDKFDAEQLSRLKIIAAYLLMGSIVASAYYLPFAIIYNKSFSILNTENSAEINYWPPFISSLSSIVWQTLLLINVIIYRNYLLTENIPNIRQETTPLLA